MPEYRKDPLSDRWVIIATERAGRPHDFQPGSPMLSGASDATLCPFCPGNEWATPKSVATFPESAAAKWSVRVIPNKYPAVCASDLDSRAADPRTCFSSAPAFGVHEVIIESPRHICYADELTIAEQELALAAHQDCLRRAANNPELKYGLIFKNQGALAGASISHIHSQFLATRLLPARVHEELSAAERFFSKHRQCIFCDILSQEIGAGTRLVSKWSQFTCYAPFASRFPHEVWLLPNTHLSRFEDLQTGQLRELAGCMQEIMIRLRKILEEPSFNWWLHTAPFDTANYDHYHWHIEIIPRTNNIAGFEWGTDCFINTVAPESAAESLRAAY